MAAKANPLPDSHQKRPARLAGKGFGRYDGGHMAGLVEEEVVEQAAARAFS